VNIVYQAECAKEWWHKASVIMDTAQNGPGRKSVRHLVTRLLAGAVLLYCRCTSPYMRCWGRNVRIVHDVHKMKLLPAFEDSGLVMYGG